MSGEGALGEIRRPFFSTSLWVPLMLIVFACAAILYYGHAVVRALESSVAATARAGGEATAREIAGVLERETQRLNAYVAEKRDAVRRIVERPDDWETIEALRSGLTRMFPGVFAFVITDALGRPLFEDFDGLIGQVCESAMQTYAQTLGFDNPDYRLPPIHPVPAAYHFDLLTSWRLEDGRLGLFFVSMAPQRIAELLRAAEDSSGSRVLLVNRSDPALIEVSSRGARDVLGDDFRLPPEDLVPGYFSTDLPGTSWRLLVLPDATALAGDVRAVYVKTAALVVGLLLISATLLFLIRRAEQRNSSMFMRSLQSSVSRQRAILQSMVDGMVTIDATGRMLHVNDAVTRLFGYPAGELVGSNVSMLMPDHHREAHDGYLQHYLTTGESKILGKGREVMARRRDGSLFPIKLTLGESIEGDDHIFVGILHDMTDYRAAQRKIDAQALEIKRSHQELDEISQLARKDLQLPLLRIASIGESLGAGLEGALSGPERVQLKSLSAEARDVSEMIKGLADYAHVDEPPGPEAVSLDKVLEEVRGDLADKIDASGAAVLHAGLPRVSGDPRQLRQLFWNLLDNAVKFRHPDRPPRIEVKPHAVPGHGAGGDAGEAGDAGDFVAIDVCDNGIGIPADQLEAVFDAFRRLHPRETYPGMGLGLSFCRKIVEGMGGDIRVSSQEGAGSVFHLRLPLAQQAPGDPAAGR